MTPEQAAQQLAARGSLLRLEVERATQRAIDRVKEAAEARSSGTLTPAGLQALDHPYARRHGSPRRDPDTVNRQTGAFADAWEAVGPQRVADGFAGAVFNTDDKAALLEAGTGVMFPRHPHEAALADVEQELEGMFADALSRALGV